MYNTFRVHKNKTLSLSNMKNMYCIIYNTIHARCLLYNHSLSIGLVVSFALPISNCIGNEFTRGGCLHPVDLTSIAILVNLKMLRNIKQTFLRHTNERKEKKTFSNRGCTHNLTHSLFHS